MPKVDSKLKVVLHEAYGINAFVSLCTDETKQSSCTNFSDQVGTTEIMYTDLKKGKKYVVKIEYDDSVIDMHKFKECPHIQIELSLISTQEQDSLVKQ